MQLHPLTTTLLALALGACAPVDSEPTCDASADADGDGLDDCAEADLGTDPTDPDSDGDGFADLEEIDCVSNPMDDDEVCYACGWGHNDPGDLVETGNDVGDVVANVQLVDQCGEELPLWDLSGEYHILFMTAAW